MSKGLTTSDTAEQLKLLEIKLKEAEAWNKQLQNKLSKYELAASGARDGLWDWDIVNDIKFASEPYKHMLGYADHEYDPNAPNAFENLVHPDDGKSFKKSTTRFLQSKDTAFSTDVRLRHKNGSYRWIHIRSTVIRDEKGRALRVSGSHTDITDEKVTQDAVRRSENKYRNLFENSIVGMFRAMKSEGIILEANDKFWEMLAIEEENRENRTFKEFCVDENEFLKIKNAIFEHGQIDGIDVEIRRDDGELIWVLFSVSTSRSGRKLECVIKDITETRMNFLELQKVNFELDSFVYHASHDLRSPLRSVLGLIGLYRMDVDERTKEDCIEKMEGSIKRLDDLVQELLSMSRNNRVNDPMVPVYFMNEVSNSVASYSNTFNTKDLSIITNISQTVPFVSDVTRIRIILNNIISNAVKYRSFDKESAHVLIDVNVDEDKAVVSVEDNGEGIPESKINSVFDMFYRATENSEGSGLGLYIVQNVAQKLNAKIKIDSQELEGTKFIVEIPNCYGK